MSHPIKDILLEAGCKLTDCGKFWKTAATYRGGVNRTSLSIDKRTGWAFDFGTNAKFSPEALTQILAGKHVDFSSFVVEEAVEKIKVSKTYNKDVLKRLLPDYDLFLDRGISKETLDLFEAGLATSGKLRNRICFPIYNRKGKIMGFSGRWFKENKYDEIPKWKHVVKKQEACYPCHLNEQIIREKREIIITESIGDTIKLWEAGFKTGLCIFGTSISNKQLTYIIGLDPSRIIVATNNDEVDSKGPAAARKIQGKLLKFFAKEKVMIRLPTLNDFGCMTATEIHKWYAAV